MIEMPRGKFLEPDDIKYGMTLNPYVNKEKNLFMQNSEIIQYYKKCKYWFADPEDAELFAFAYLPIIDESNCCYLMLADSPYKLKEKYTESTTKEQEEIIYKKLKSLANEKLLTSIYIDKKLCFYMDELIEWCLKQDEFPKKRLNRILELKKTNMSLPIFNDHTPITNKNICVAVEGLKEMCFILWQDFLEIFAIVPGLEDKLKHAINDKVIYGVINHFLDYQEGIQYLLKENLFPLEYKTFFETNIKAFLTNQVIHTPPKRFTLEELAQILNKREIDILEDAYNEHFGAYLRITESNIVRATTDPPEILSNPKYTKRFTGFERIFPDILTHLGYHHSEYELTIKNFMDNPEHTIKIKAHDHSVNGYCCLLQATTAENKYCQGSEFNPNEDTVFTKDKLVFFEEEVNEFYNLIPNNGHTSKIEGLKIQIGFADIKGTENNRAGEIAKHVLNALAQEFGFNVNNPPRTRKYFHQFLKYIDPTFDQAHETLRRNKVNTVTFRNGPPSPTEKAKWDEIFTAYGLILPEEKNNK